MEELLQWTTNRLQRLGQRIFIYQMGDKDGSAPWWTMLMAAESRSTMIAHHSDVSLVLGGSTLFLFSLYDDIEIKFVE